MHKASGYLFTCLLSLCSVQTTNPAFRKSEMSVPRRFSDFLGIHAKLAERHIPQGIVVPPAPEKSVIGKSARVKTELELWDLVGPLLFFVVVLLVLLICPSLHFPNPHAHTLRVRHGHLRLGGGRAVNESVAQSKGTHFQKPEVEHDQVLGFTTSSRFLQSRYLCRLYRKNETKH